MDAKSKEESSVEIIPKFTKKNSIRILKLSSVLICFFVLAALSASLPSTKPYGIDDLKKLSVINTGDTAWVLISSALVLLMTPSLGLFYGGMVNHKNVISTMYQSFVSMSLISVIWVIVGFSLAFGKDNHGNRIMGSPATYYMYKNVGALPHESLAPTIPLSIFSMFHLMFAVITPIIISGSTAERVNFNSWLLFICIWHLVVYCPLAHMVWHPDGILKKWGYMDFAGGLVVEMSSGFGALAAAIYLGPRKDIISTPANIPFVMLGTGLLWFGWFGFNAGSAMAAGELACQAFATTNTAAASAMMTWIILDFILDKTSSAVGACNGAVLGLVAITPACGYVTVGGAMCIGCIACVMCYTIGLVFKERTGIDDSLDVFTIHGLGGFCGVVLTGMFSCSDVNPAASNGLVYGGGVTFGKQLAVAVVAFPFIMLSTLLCCGMSNAIVPFRVTEEEEHMGLDITMHSESLPLIGTLLGRRSD